MSDRVENIINTLSNLSDALTQASRDIEMAEAADSIPGADNRKLVAAAAEQAVATFEYRKPDDSQYSVRVVRVEDFGTAVDHKRHCRFEYIKAWDYDRAEYRSFRLHRIRTGSVKVAS